MQQIFIWMALILLSACSSVHHSKKQILSTDADVRELDHQLQEATAKQVQLLSPFHFQEAAAKLKLALEQAGRSQDGKGGNATAKEGLKSMAKAVEVANLSRQTLAEALAKREEAMVSEGHAYFQKEFKELDEKLMNAGHMMEEAQLDKAREANLKLAAAYSALEVRALKTGVGQEAEEALKAAYQVGAEKFAPKTFSAAKNELEVAKKIIEIEKTDLQNAQAHSEHAKYLADKAKAITAIIVAQNKDGLTHEEKILWYYAQMAAAFEPFHEVPPFDLPNAEMVSTMAQRVQGLFNFIGELEGQSRANEKKITALDGKIEGLVNEKEKIELRAERKKELEESLQHMFDPNEAEVLRKGDEILIRSYGFTFPVGSAELKASNFTLLHKLVSAILKFPKAKITVVGNTDSTGSNEFNMSLSLERAKNIADFLVKVAGIDQSRVVAKGMGDTQPLAPNTTAAGRARNRRIEIHIDTTQLE